MSPRSTLLALLAVAALSAPMAHAQLRLTADTLTLPGASLRKIGASLVAQAAPAPPRLRLHAQSLDLPALGWRAVGVDFDGSLARRSRNHWVLDGTLQLRGAVGGAWRQGHLQVELDADENTLQASLVQNASGSAELALPLDQPTHLQIELKQVPLGWLQGVLAPVWKQGKLGAGRIDATLAVDLQDDGLRSTGRFDLSGAGFDSRQGTLAGQALAGSGTWALQTGSQASSLNLDTRLRGGELLLGPLYAKLPAHASQLQLRAGFDNGGVKLTTLHFDDGDALRLDGSASFDTAGTLTALDLDGFRAQLPDAYVRYGQSWLATLGYDTLDTAGMLTGSLAMHAGTLERFAFDADGVRAVDPAGRIGVDGLQGRIDWAHDGKREPGRLAWHTLTLLHLPLGSATTQWQSRDGVLHLDAPAAVPLLGGNVSLQRLDWSPAAGVGQPRLDTALVATGIDLEPLCALFGWPKFQGVLAGAVPGLHYQGDRIDLDGGLSVNVFDGFVDVTRLSLQHPFGSAPVLNANVAMRGLDLDPLTRVFDFGSISGRLAGSIDGLRMVAWQPVAFDASLRADEGGRISQRAIDSLSNLGGGGFGSGLQATVLKVFKSFGYDRIGLDCKLRDDICQMGGLGSADGGGYVIVDGRGLPHIKVVGHQHEVDWPTLVARLEAATKGGGVRVE
jgi:hypothetical protein